MDSIFSKTERSLQILRGLGVAFDHELVMEAVRRYRGLCSTWNLAAKLMSAGDLETHFDEHVADSLSLVGLIRDAVGSGCSYVDIGSGGGFPAIPVGLCLPGLQGILVERSAAKADFLRQAVVRLGLTGYRVIQAPYPCEGLPQGPQVYTARATEKPLIVDRGILSGLKRGDVYLAQREVNAESLGTDVSMAKVEDEFTGSGLRRGILYKVWR